MIKNSLKKTSPRGATSKIMSKGFAILYASLIGSLVLAIGIAILNVTIKQITLSSAGRESQHAFYAADTGVECAEYFDRGAGGNQACTTIYALPSGDPAITPSICLNGTNAQPYNYQCVGQTVTFEPTPLVTTTGVTTHFSVETNPIENICFDVYVTKTTDDKTTVDSRGYSTCDPNVANRFERAIRSSF